MFEEKGLSLSGIVAQIQFLRHDLFDIVDAVIERNPQSDAIKVLITRAADKRVHYIADLVNGTGIQNVCNAEAPPQKRQRIKTKRRRRQTV